MQKEKKKRKRTHPPPLNPKHKKAKTRKAPKVKQNVVSFPPLSPLVVQPLFGQLLPKVVIQVIMDYYFPIHWILVSAADYVENNTEEMRWYFIPENEPFLQDLTDKEDQVTEEMLPFTKEEKANSRWRPFRIKYPYCIPSNIVIQRMQHFCFQY